MDFTQLVEELPKKSDKEKREIALALRRLSGNKKTVKHQKIPTTDDELWEYIRDNLGYEIPRVAVCEDHTAPFDYVADFVFERYKAILVLGGRESAKTLNTAIANYVNSEIKPGCESCTFANIEQQSNKSYAYIKSFLYTTDESGKKVLKSTIEGEPLRKETKWKNGSKIEVIIGTVSGVNSPHPQKVHADEVDLLDEPIWEEAQPLDIELPTPTGLRFFGDLKLGDLVFGADGRATKINKINEVGEKDIYKITFVDGRSTECCLDHIWRVYYKNYKQWENKKTKKILEDYKIKDKRFDNGWVYRYKIPQQKCAEYGYNDLPINPYVLGVLLGDGCFRQATITFRSIEEDIVDRVERLLPDDIHINELQDSGDSYSKFNIVYKGNGVANPIKKIIKELELDGTNSHTKFIPSTYLESSKEDRIELIRGLMDTDGSFTKDPYFASVSEELANNFKELVQSVGGRALIRKKNTSSSGFSGGCGYIYEVSASLPEEINPFWCKRKADKFIPRQRTLDPSIRSIDFVGKKVARCIGVENSDGLYLTNEFIVTHNSRNMASSKRLPNGTEIKAQNIATSTLKSTKGIMQKLMDESAKAEKAGLKPVWKVYKSCVYEVAKEVPNCRTAPKDLREARLKELGRDPCELCECNRIVKGEIADGVPRTLDLLCKGKFFRSRGWMSYEDVTEKFVQNTPNKWASQLECRRPMADGLYLPTWNRERHTIKNWEPRPEYGYIWQGVDWGGTAASFIIWVQGPLHQAIEAKNNIGTITVVPKGAYVVFKELSEAAMGATRLAGKVVRQEIQYKNQFPGWRVKGRFADMAGKQQRMDWAEHNPPLRTNWYVKGRDVDPQIECIQGLVVDNLLYVDSFNCPNLADDYESWRQEKGHEVHDDSSHGPAACLIAGTKVKTNNGDINIEDIKTGDFVYTREGLKEVEWSGQSGINKQTIWKAYFSDGSSLEGTADHPVWVDGRGFINLAALRYHDTILAWKKQTQVDAKMYIAKESDSVDGLKRKTPIYSIIIGDIIGKTVNKLKLTCIDLFGKIFMGRFPKDIMYTTLMKIGIIILLQIYLVYLHLSILVDIRRDINIRLQINTEKLDQKISLNQSIGQDQKVRQHEKKLARLQTKKNPYLIKFARYVVYHIKQKLPNQNSVQIIASHDGAENQELTTRLENVLSAAINFLLTSIQRFKPVPVYVVKVCEQIEDKFVFDLQVKDCHEFYANNILVHNTRYALINITTYTRRNKNINPASANAVPVVVHREQPAIAGQPQSSVTSDVYSSEAWRKTLGPPMGQDRGPSNWRP